METKAPQNQTASFLRDGSEMAELIRAYDWSRTSIGGMEGWPVSLRTLLNMMLTSRFPMLIFWGPDLITFYNDAFRPSLGENGKHPSSLGQKGEQSWAESWPVIGPMIYNIMAGGESVWFEDQKLPIYREGRMDYAYWTYSFSSLIDDDGKVAGVLVTCSETTKSVEGGLRIKESRQRLLSLFEQSPIAVAIIEKENLTFRMANKFYGELVDRKPEDLIDKPLLEALPEIAGQGFDDLLNKVMETGVPFISKDVSVQLLRGNVMETVYVDLAYQPLRDVDDYISGVLVVAIDMTLPVVTRKKMESTEAFLLGAIELAELGTWHIDVPTRGVTYSPRLQEWLGIAKSQLEKTGSIHIVDEDRERIRIAIEEALLPEGSGSFDEVYTILNRQTGQQRIIHASGKTIFDEQKNAVSLSGTAQDITIQRKLQTELELEVQTSAEELAAVVSKLKSTNEALAETNRQLTHSNEELSQYAYVASHDLQEPLRKIKMFSSVLSTQEQLPEHIRKTIIKIQNSTDRMSLLIKDLLEFSQLLKSDSLIRPVNLGDIVQAVKDDFDLVITEKAAEIVIGELPVIEAVSLQMNQLFYNLIGNALKFTKDGRKPVIGIHSRRANAEEITAHVDKPIEQTPYVLITVKDNGIGFETRFVDQIFEVFKRLHGRGEYAGSGIGLALCRRILQNHGGQIYAESEPDQGTSFHLLLPERQKRS